MRNASIEFSMLLLATLFHWEVSRQTSMVEDVVMAACLRVRWNIV